VTNGRQAGVIPPKQPARRTAAPREDATDNANQVCVEPLTSGGSADVAQQDVGRGQRLSHRDGLPGYVLPIFLSEDQSARLPALVARCQVSGDVLPWLAPGGIAPADPDRCTSPPANFALAATEPVSELERRGAKPG